MPPLQLNKNVDNLASLRGKHVNKINHFFLDT